jgi:hypothetical protein
VLVNIETTNGFVIARDVMPHDAKEIVDLHNAYIVDRIAPEMLEALEAIYEISGEANIPLHTAHDVRKMGKFLRIREQVKTAIAKARGEGVKNPLASLG